MSGVQGAATNFVHQVSDTVINYCLEVLGKMVAPGIAAAKSSLMIGVAVIAGVGLYLYYK